MHIQKPEIGLNFSRHFEGLLTAFRRECPEPALGQQFREDLPERVVVFDEQDVEWLGHRLFLERGRAIEQSLCRYDGLAVSSDCRIP